MNSAPSLEHRLPWWKERMVWLIIILPVSAVVASVATFFIAAHDADDMVKTEYVKSGMAVDAPRDALEKAAQMGISATLAYRDGTLVMHVDKLDRLSESLHLTLVHPTQAKLDQEIPLSAVAQGKYQAHIELTGQGKRHLILEPPDHAWRLEGEWLAPFNEETNLHAAAQHPSMHP